MNSTIGVTQIDHVTLLVKELSESRRFYVDLLGMREAPRPAFSFAGLWFEAGATQIHLILDEGRCTARPQETAKPDRETRRHHFAFTVADAAAAARQLQDRGIPLVGGLKTRPDGALQAFVTDPDGHLIELCSRPQESGASNRGA